MTHFEPIVPVPGGRTFEQQLRYFAQVVKASGTAATDFGVLSVLRTLGDMQAVQGERFGEQLLVAVAEGINRATYRSFGFNLLPAAQAYGEVVFTRASGTVAQTIPRNTIVSIPGSTRRFLTYEDLEFPVGILTGTASIIAEAAGAAWNTNANSITAIVSGGATGFSVTNLKAIVTGRDEETDDERRVRFANYIQSIHRSTADAIEYGARTAALYDGFGLPTEFIHSAQVVDDGVPGIARCYVWNGETNPANDAVSATLLALVRRILYGYTTETGQKVPGYKAAGAQLNIIPATITAADVSVAVYPATGWTLAMVEQGVREAIERVFSRFSVGDGYLRLADLRNVIGSVRGVIDHEFAEPTSILNPTAAPSISLVTNTGGLTNPTSIPTLGTTGSGGALLAGDYTVAYAYRNATGTTKVSPTATVSLGAGESITVDWPTPPVGATETDVYVSQAANSTTLKFRIAVAAPGTDYTVATLPSGALIPTENTTAPSLPPGDYRATYSWKTGGGQTVAAPLSSITTTGSQNIRFDLLSPISGATGVNYFISVQPGNAQPLGYAGTGSGAQKDISALPEDPSYTAPVANTTANIAGGEGVILVPGTITITEGV